MWPQWQLKEMLYLVPYSKLTLTPSMIVKRAECERDHGGHAQQKDSVLSAASKQVSKSWAEQAEPWDKARHQRASWWLAETQSPFTTVSSWHKFWDLQNKAREEWNLTFPHSANTEDTVQTPASVPLQWGLAQSQCGSEELEILFSMRFLSAFNLFKCVEGSTEDRSPVLCTHPRSLNSFLQRPSHTAECRSTLQNTWTIQVPRPPRINRPKIQHLLRVKSIYVVHENFHPEDPFSSGISWNPVGYSGYVRLPRAQQQILSQGVNGWWKLFPFRLISSALEHSRSSDRIAFQGWTHRCLSVLCLGKMSVIG